MKLTHKVRETRPDSLSPFGERAGLRGSSGSRVVLALILLLPCAATVSPQAHAQGYPAKPVRVVVPLPAGGATDVITRAVSGRLSETWGQQIVIENKGGANTQIGAEAVAKSAPDGYTLLATSEATLAVNPFLYRKLAYEEKDFVPVSGLGIITQALVVHPSVPASTVAEFIALARSKPGELNYGTLGIGSSSHLNTISFESMAGVRLTPVHYRGGAPALTDVIGGHTQVLFISVTLMHQPWKAGQLKALGVGGGKRLPQFPDLPTIAESGLPGYEAVSWFGLFAPAGTSTDIIRKINVDVQHTLSDPTFQEKFLTPSFFEPILGSADAFAAYVKAEQGKWSKLIADNKVAAE
jgi:tripartite-type tricarboxylate transporter receptor subunit TctC